jgi:anti-sigma factor RsiW
MDAFLRDILEDYLSGNLSRTRKAELEAHLARHPEAVDELEEFRRTSLLLAELRPPQEELEGPETGFYARVLQCIEEQRSEPFWMFFLQPLFVRRLAEAVLQEQPSPDYYRVRLGNNLIQNRDSMLAVVMTSGE